MNCNDKQNIDLPVFKYFPDPKLAGSIVKSDKECVCCQQHRGYIYCGPVYSFKLLDDRLCPWCIADGSAHEKYDAFFTGIEEIGYSTVFKWDSVSDGVKEEIAYRTPSFLSCQVSSWWSHCGDAAEFIKVGGYKDLVKYGEDCIEHFRNDLRIGNWTEAELEERLEVLGDDGWAVACIFRCRHCGKYGGYHDVD